MVLDSKEGGGLALEEAPLPGPLLVEEEEGYLAVAIFLVELLGRFLHQVIRLILIMVAPELCPILLTEHQGHQQLLLGEFPMPHQ